MKTNTTYSKLYEIAIYSERKAEIVEKAKTISLSSETPVIEIPEVPQVPNVEDIIDSGCTLYYLIDILKKRNPNSIHLCTLLDKPERRKPGITLQPDYVGFVIPNEFVVGYGLDFNEHYRNLPYVGVLKPAVYEK